MRRLLTPRWLAGHAAVLVAVSGFLVLGWWQAGRAVEGNTLSWAYTFEWPLFAVFAIVMWIKEMRQTRSVSQVPVEKQRRGPVITRREHNGEPGDPEYNRYLAWLSEHPDAKPSDYRSIDV